jgi:hypothetical protein
MKDDVKIILAEYRMALKKNRADRQAAPGDKARARVKMAMP